MNHPSHHLTAFLKPLPLHFHEMKDSPPALPTIPPPPLFSNLSLYMPKRPRTPPHHPPSTAHHSSQTSPFICQWGQGQPPPHTHIIFLNTFPTHFQQTKDHTPWRPPLLDSQDGLEREASSTGPAPSISSSERKKQITLYHGLGNQNMGLPA